MRLIKRYPNRKLYDTGDKRYVCLDGIASLVRADEDIQVIDTKDGSDITTLVLSQILREQEKRQNFLPLSLLSNLIRRSSGGLNQLRNSFQASLHALRALEDEVQESLDTLVDRGEITLTEAQQLREELLARARNTQAALERKILKDIESSLIRLDLPTRPDLEGPSASGSDAEDRIEESKVTPASWKQGASEAGSTPRRCRETGGENTAS